MFHFFTCTNRTCRLRFPAMDGPPVCPKCGAQTAVSTAAPVINDPVTNDASSAVPLEVLLDNIRSVYNVGAILRTADGAGVRCVHLGGITAPPTHPRMAKTALGAESGLTWSHSNNGYETAVALQQRGYQLWALESVPQAEPLFSADLSPVTTPTLLIVGNEKAGIDPEILAISDRVLALPMQGIKASLNVAVACGVALYHICYGLRRTGELNDW